MSFAGRKWLRTCKLTMEVAPSSSGAGQLLTIPDGLTIEFTVTRQSLASTQTAEFKIYGLGPINRDKVYKDQFDWTQYRTVQFEAGYPGISAQIFKGTIFWAYSEKQKEEVVTTISAFDGGWPMLNGWSNLPANSGGLNSQSAKAVIEQLGNTLPNILGPPVVGDFPAKNMRGEVISGNTWGLIKQKSGGNCAISDGIVYALNPQEVLIGKEIVQLSSLNGATPDPRIPLINSDTGLLGAPRRSGTMVEWDMIFEPRLQLFQAVYIQSDFNKLFNGAYKVMGFRHHGIISKTVNGDCLTTARFLWGKGSTFAEAVAGLSGAIT